jgi:hypothetical protein
LARRATAAFALVLPASLDGNYDRKSTPGRLKIPAVAGTFSLRFTVAFGQQHEQRGICGF